MKVCLKILGVFLIWLGFIFVVPLLVSVGYHEGDSESFVLSGLITIGAGIALFFIFRKAPQTLDQRGALLAVALCWIAACLFSALPFWLSGTTGFVDALFESTSGFTTTGSSVIADVESLSKGILFWRHFTHFLGGIGILILGLAIFPLVGIGGAQIRIFYAESSGPFKEKLKPTVNQTARIIALVYSSLVALATIAYWLEGMTLFDAACHAFATIATGGFSTKNASIGYYQSPLIELTVTFFMFASGTNFALHYLLFKRGLKVYFGDSQFRFYAGLYLSLVALFTVVLMAKYGFSPFDSFRLSAFQVATINTTTGFATADFDKWPSVLTVSLFLLMFVGGCTGATSGAIKTVRVQIVLKQLAFEFKKYIHPHRVYNVRYDNNVVEPQVIRSVDAFFFLYILFFALATLGFTATGLDFKSSATATTALMGNIGPGLGSVGPISNFGHLVPLAKLLSALCMLVGRLEIYPILLLLFPEFWRSLK